MRTLHFFCTLKSSPRERGILMFENMIMKWRESKMKKLIALLMASVLALSLAACSNSGNNNSQAPENNSQTPASQPADNSTAPSQSADQEISGTVNTNGSTSMDEVMGFLKEAFEELHDGVLRCVYVSFSARVAAELI